MYAILSQNIDRDTGQKMGDCMAICTFFGHRDATDEIKDGLRSTIEYLINEKNVDMFYVGDSGNFDYKVTQILKELQQYYTNIKYAVVLAYINKKKSDDLFDNINSVYPENLENKPLRYAIYHRNKWMIEKSDYVITYVRHHIGGAAQFKEIAERKGKIVINIG